VGVVHAGQRIDLGAGLLIEEVVAPPRLIGRTLRELDLRRDIGVHVLLLRGLGGESGGAVRVPGPDELIRAGDRLVVAGTAADLARLERLGRL
jgi:Trk K+ transport system NAD-binding subunit